MKRIGILNLTIISVLFAGGLFTFFKAMDYRSHVNYFLDKYTYVVTEFSGRQKYAENDHHLMAEKPQAPRIVFLGDQVIEDWDLAGYFNGIEPINRGITGQRLSGFILRMRPDVLNLLPKAVIIQFSSYNFRPWDSLEEVKDYITDLVDLSRANGVEPILTTVLPVRNGLDYYRSEDFKPYPVSNCIAQFNGWLVNFCRRRDCHLIDFNKAVADKDGNLAGNFSIDNTHLNDAGFKRLAAVTNKALADLNLPGFK